MKEEVGRCVDFVRASFRRQLPVNMSSDRRSCGAQIDRAFDYLCVGKVNIYLSQRRESIECPLTSKIRQA